MNTETIILALVGTIIVLLAMGGVGAIAFLRYNAKYLHMLYEGASPEQQQRYTDLVNLLHKGVDTAGQLADLAEQIAQPNTTTTTAVGPTNSLTVTTSPLSGTLIGTTITTRNTNPVTPDSNSTTDTESEAHEADQP